MPQLKNVLIVVKAAHTCHCRQLLLEGADKPKAGNTPQGAKGNIISIFCIDKDDAETR